MMERFGQMMAEARWARRFVVVLAVTLPAWFPCAAIGADINRAVIADPDPDPSFPATAAAIVVPSKGVGMNAQFYLAAGAGPHPTMLLLHGTPGNEQNLDLAQAARRAGWNVLTLHYRGSWASGGEYSLSNALVDTDEAMAFLRAPETVAKYRIDVRRLVIAGHSTGGYNAGRYAAAHPSQLAGAVLIDAWNAGPMKTEGRRERHLKAFQREGQMLRVSSPEQYVDDFWSQPPLMQFASALTGTPLLIICADKAYGVDNQALSAAIAKIDASRLQTTTIPTDHIFSDRRIELASTLLNWLDRVGGH
jgi:pimeloyl-ACP methyl ester carboxylesterase